MENLNVNKTKLIVVPALFAILIALLSCKIANRNERSYMTRDGEKFSETKIIKKSNASLVYANINLFAGDLEINSGSKNLMEGKFIYDDADYKPEVVYDETNDIGNLEVSLDKVDVDTDFDKDSDSKDYNPDWNIGFNNEVPIDLTVKLGAGRGKFYLGELNLKDFELATGAGEFHIDLRNSSVPTMEFRAGAGEATVDLSGKRKNSLDAEFICGVGELTVILPKDLGVQVEAVGLIGSISHPGFEKNGSEYTNDKFGATEHFIRLKITGGIGEINLKVVD